MTKKGKGAPDSEIKEDLHDYLKVSFELPKRIRKALNRDFWLEYFRPIVERCPEMLSYFPKAYPASVLRKFLRCPNGC